MAEEEVLAPAPAAVADLKRKLDDLEPDEALEHAEGMRDDEAKNGDDVEKNSDGFVEADGYEAKRPRLNDDKTEKPDGAVNANGLNEEKPDEVVDAEQPTEDTTKEEEQEILEVKTEQHSSLQEHVLVDNQQISVKEDTKEILISTKEASIGVKEETEEVTVKEKETVKEESVEPSTLDPQQVVDNSKLDELSSTNDLTMSCKIEVPNNKVDAGGSLALVARALATAQASGDAKQVTGDLWKIVTLRRNSSKLGILETVRNVKIISRREKLGASAPFSAASYLMPTVDALVGAGDRELLYENYAVERGFAYSVDSVPQLKADDISIVRVTGPRADVVFLPQLPSDINLMKDALVYLGQNDIRCQVMESFTEKQLITDFSCSGQRVIIATDHGAGGFLDKIAFCTSGVVIGVPMRASEVSGVSASLLGFPVPPGEVTGVPASLLGMSPELRIVLVGANDAMEAAKLAMSIFAFGHPEARILKML